MELENTVRYQVIEFEDEVKVDEHGELTFEEGSILGNENTFSSLEELLHHVVMSYFGLDNQFARAENNFFVTLINAINDALTELEFDDVSKKDQLDDNLEYTHSDIMRLMMMMQEFEIENLNEEIKRLESFE